MGASCNCISEALWDKIKTSNKLIKSSITLTGAGGSKLGFLGFADVTCSKKDHQRYSIRYAFRYKMGTQIQHSHWFDQER